MDLFEIEKPAAKPSGAAAPAGPPKTAGPTKSSGTPAGPPKTAGPTKSSGTGRPTTQTTRTDNQAVGRPPKCWFCPGYHLNRDCPQPPQGFRDRHAAPKTKSGEE
ncbi:hypothetical protein QE152_g38038 [Popillia japonica]|uniref:Uncharacterized protein n=1 Tax=Popillia japonica TaxID=7064 RepID=A0AAW1I8I1_POPJA